MLRQIAIVATTMVFLAAAELSISDPDNVKVELWFIKKELNMSLSSLVSRH